MRSLYTSVEGGWLCGWHKELTSEVQEALGQDKILIGKRVNHTYVKAVEYLKNSINSIKDLIVGKVMQVHVPVNISCSGDTRLLYITTFLIGADKYCYLE